MIINPLSHYSMQNVHTVFDEEALTALELCGRLACKVNEIITAVNGYNVPAIVNVSPTGDKTGELDRAVIQGKLDKGYSVHLSAGEYYLNGPLIFRPGYMLRGDSQLNTVVNCKAGFIDHENNVSVDHVQVRDVRVKGPGSGVGIDISRKVSGAETGGRYSQFMNVYITGYSTGIRLKGCWCANFIHCRIEVENGGICVEQLGSNNHIRYDHCIFLGPDVDDFQSIGVKITAEGGAENYGVSFDHCDFERHDKAIHAYYCVSLNVFSIYAEGVNTIFQLDSCPGFLCDGGYISYTERVCNTARTNDAPIFDKCSGAIKNLVVRVNAFDTFYLVSTGSNAPLEVTNINCVNEATGECIVNAQCANGIWNGHEHHLISEVCNVSPLNLLTTKRPFMVEETGSSYNLNNYKNRPGNRFKLQQFKILFTNSFTPTTSTTLVLEIRGDAIGREDTNYHTLMEAYLNAGTAYNAGSTLTFTYMGESYRDLIISDLTSIKLRPTTSNFASEANGKPIFTLASGEMVL